MRPTEVVTVSDARSQLPQLLSRLQDDGPSAEPVFIGAHRKASGVLISLELFEELTELREKFERREAVASAWGSLSAERLTPTPQFLKDAEEYTNGELAVDDLVQRAVRRHRR